MLDAERDAGRPSDKEMLAYLEGQHGPPHPEAVRIIQDALVLATTCCCESSPPEFGGNLPDRECPLHGDGDDA